MITVFPNFQLFQKKNTSALLDWKYIRSNCDGAWVDMHLCLLPLIQKYTKYYPCLFGLESREYGRRDPSRWPRGTLYPQKLALTSPTSGGRSVGIDLSRTQATEFCLLPLFGMWGHVIWYIFYRRFGRKEVNAYYTIRCHTVSHRSHRSH
jgi:hypothetical protein